MATDITTPLLSPSSPSRLLPTPLYVLVFPNVLTDKGVREDEEYKAEIDISNAEKVRKRLLRPIQGDQSLYETLLQKISWTGSSLTKAEYVKSLVSAVVWILQEHCELDVNLYLSRDQTQVYCTIHARDEVLERRAEAVRYRLQMFRPAEARVQESSTGEKTVEETEEPSVEFNFMRVFPYVEFHPNLKNVLQRYDEDGAKSGEGSLFTPCDKTRLVFSLISSDFSLGWLQAEGLLQDHFCMHDILHNRRLLKSWATLSALFHPQPLQLVRNYFGEKVALYFAWIGFYCRAMIWPAVAGCFCFLAGWVSDQDGKKVLALSFAVFLAIWASLFDHLWSRNERKLAWSWGTVDSSETEEQRAEFQGPPAKDPVTGQEIKGREGTLGTLKRMLSFSVLAVFVTAVIAAVIGIFIYRAILIQRKEEDGPLLCALLNAVQIKVMNVVYTLVAQKMNNWENHETETQYMDSLSLKLFLFRFVNCFVSLFYIAFIKEHYEGCEGNQCSEELAFQLVVIFLMNVSLNLMELGWPYADFWIRAKLEDRKVQRLRNEHPERGIRITISPTEKQAQLDPYATPMEDYMEMVCQYGYIVLFSSVFPVVALLALGEILIEIRVDALKLCTLNRRSFPYRTESIGIWHTIILMVSYVGIATNSALIVFDSHHPIHLLPFGPWLNFLVLEHLFLAFKYLIPFLAPSESTVVRLGRIWQDRVASDVMFGRKDQSLDESKLIQDGEVGGNMKGDYRLKREDVKSPS